MFKSFKNSNIDTSNKAFDMVKTLPKYCSCSACENIRDKARQSVGHKEFNKVAKKLGLII